MSEPRGVSALVAALGVALTVLGLQLLSAVIAPLGASIRQSPLIPIVLLLVTAVIAFRLIRSR